MQVFRSPGKTSLNLSVPPQIQVPASESLYCEEDVPQEIFIRKASQEGNNNDVSSSIKYAKRIQDAMMLKEKHLFRLFPESFMLFKPRDVVSGDFYWFTKINEKIIVAVADCTGHGIPGAFMSVLGISLLNQIIIEEQNSDPSFILQRLNHKVNKAFSNAYEAGQASYDGMDISLCCIDYRSMTVTFSGALRPVYFICREGLREIKGSRYPIGGLNLEAERKYESQKFSFSQGDKLYLFSDGYADQFGGASDKKLMTKKFKSILGRLYYLSMNTQCMELDRILNDWKGSGEQTDDVLVIGVKL